MWQIENGLEQQIYVALIISKNCSLNDRCTSIMVPITLNMLDNDLHIYDRLCVTKNYSGVFVCCPYAILWLYIDVICDGQIPQVNQETGLVGHEPAQTLMKIRSDKVLRPNGTNVHMVRHSVIKLLMNSPLIELCKMT